MAMTLRETYEYRMLCAKHAPSERSRAYWLMRARQTGMGPDHSCSDFSPEDERICDAVSLAEAEREFS